MTTLLHLLFSIGCRSKVPTSIRPVQGLESVSVMLDACEAGAAECVSDIVAYFRPLGIRVRIYVVVGCSRKSVDPALAKFPEVRFVNAFSPAWYLRSRLAACPLIAGSRQCFRLRDSLTRIDGYEDIFIDLTTGRGFVPEYAALHSNAVFKIGREQYRRELFDLAVVNSDSYSQHEVFDYAVGLFAKIV